MAVHRQSLRASRLVPVWPLNGKRFDPDRSDAKVSLDEIELWRFRNERTLLFLGRPHAAHVHLAHFQIL